MLPGLLLSIFFWAIHQFINADVKDLCENIQLNVFDHPLARIQCAVWRFY